MADSRAIRAGKAEVELSTSEAGLVSGLEAAKKHLHNFAKSTSTIMMGGGGALAGLGASIEAPLAMFMKEAVSHITDIRKAADQLGQSTDSFSKVSYAAGKVGMDLDGVVGAGRRLERMIAAAMGGNKAAADSFKKLGIDAGALEQLPLDEKMKAIADGIAALPDESLRTQAAFQLLGKTGVALLPILRQGGDALERMFKEGGERGLIVSPAEAARVKEFTKAVAGVEQSLKGLKMAIGVAVIPDAERLNRFTSALSRGIQQTREWIEHNQQLVAGLSVGAVAAIALGAAFVTAGAMIAGAGAVASGVVAILDLLLVPAFAIPVALAGVAIAGTALGVLLASLVTSTEDEAAAAKSLADHFDAMADAFVQSWGAISAALKTGDLEGAWDVTVSSLTLIWKTFVYEVMKEWQTLKMQLQKDLLDAGLVVPASMIKFDKQGMRDASDAVRKASDDLIRKKSEVINRAADKAAELDAGEYEAAAMREWAREQAGGKGFSPGEAANIADALSSVASHSQFGGSNAANVLGIGAGVRESPEAKELQKLNTKADEMNRHLEAIEMNDEWGS